MITGNVSQGYGESLFSSSVLDFEQLAEVFFDRSYFCKALFKDQLPKVVQNG